MSLSILNIPEPGTRNPKAFLQNSMFLVDDYTFHGISLSIMLTMNLKHSCLARFLVKLKDQPNIVYSSDFSDV